MDNKSELFDLAREKRELDDFLSTIAGDEASSELRPPADGGLKPESPADEGQLELQTHADDQTAWQIDVEPEMTSESESDSIIIDKDIPAPSFEEFLTESKESTHIQEQQDDPFFDFDVDQRPASPRVVPAPAVKPLESFKTMTRYDGTIKPETSPDESLDVEKRSQVQTQTDRRGGKESLPSNARFDKKSASEVYDFAPAKKGGKGKWIALVIILVLLLGGGYLWFSSGTSVPGLGDIFKTGLTAPGVSAKEIKLINVRQRLVYNTKLGKSIRIIEGAAENTATFPVSEIKISANLYNADGSLLVTKETLGGNVLNDAKLESLDENGFLAELKKTNASREIIPPGGQIPFMVILTREMEGVHRMSVKATDFARH